MGHIIGTQRDHIGRSSLILARHHILVLLRILLGLCLGRSIQVVEHVFLGIRRREAVLDQLRLEITAEGLCCREEHSAAAHGIALDKVEIAIGIRLVVIVQTVAAQELQQRLVLHPLLRDIGQIHTSRITLELDVETELGLLHRRGEIIHVLHHQVPVALRGVVRRVLQRLHEQRQGGIRQIAGKLTDLIGHATRGKLVGDGQHLIRLQTCLQRHVTQRLVDGIFRGREQTGTSQFLIVATHLKLRDCGQNGCGLVDVTGAGIVVHQFAILAVGSIAWHLLVRQLPMSIHHLRVLADICQRDEVTAVGGCSRLVGHPDFHAVDLDT